MNEKILTPLLDSIINDFPAPPTKKGSVQLQIMTLDYNDYVGRIGIGRVFRGKLNKSEKLSIIKRNGTIHRSFNQTTFCF